MVIKLLIISLFLLSGHPEIVVVALIIDVIEYFVLVKYIGTDVTPDDTIADGFWNAARKGNFTLRFVKYIQEND